MATLGVVKGGSSTDDDDGRVVTRDEAVDERLIERGGAVQEVGGARSLHPLHRLMLVGSLRT